MAKSSQSDRGFSFDFKSGLKTGAERFLSRVIVHALEDNWRTPEDFLRHFGPLDLMKGLEPAPELRKNILVVAAGVHEKIARKKSIESAAEDLALALEEDVTSAADILSLFPPDDRVRYLDHGKLWAFAVEDEFYAPAKAGRNEDRSIDRMTFMLEAAMAEDLVTLQDIADGITFEAIAQRLPMEELQRVVEHALTTGRNGNPLTEDSLLEVLSLRTLIGFIPLDQIWETVIMEKVARPAHLTEVRAKGESKKESRPGRESKKEAAASNGKKVQPGAKKADDLKSVEDDVDDLLEAADAPAGEGRSPAEEEARRKVVSKLTEVQRLPPGHDKLSTAILLSVESMYSELLTASTDEAREECIRDSFPNEQHLTTALLALIELLDPSIDTKDAVIRDADVDSLLKVVLFEERQRYEQAHPSQRPAGSPSSPPPLPGKRPSQGGPPPLPRSVPPPLPTAEKPR